MSKLWEGRFSKALNAGVDDFNSSILVDARMFKMDILGSIAHATMLGKTNIIDNADAEKIVGELKVILAELENGTLPFDVKAEDIHSFVENELTKRLGVAGKKLHTARSRNDQVALDFKMYVKEQNHEIRGLLKMLINVLLEKAEDNLDTVMPGYTHMQRAQPITFAHHLMAYAEMFRRDILRLSNAFQIMDFMPLGSGALASTTYKIDRNFVAEQLGFSGVTSNSLDGVSDRDFALELLGDLSIIMIHLSRFCEEIILWCSWEFRFVELDDGFATGSSIMPQKKNPDIAELVRGKSGRVLGDMNALFTVMKSLPLAYNKDMQEDKESAFDAIDTVKKCLATFAPMIETMKVNKQNMRLAGEKGFINATDCADYLVKKGLAFRDAYKIVGQLVAFCIANNQTLDSLPIAEYKKFDEHFADDVYKAISLATCVAERNVIGGPSPSAVEKHIVEMKTFVAGV